MSILSLPKQKPPVRRNRPLDEVRPERKFRTPSISLGRVDMRFRPVAGLRYMVLGIVLALAAGFGNHYVQNLPMQNIEVEIIANDDNQFLDYAMVKDMMGIEDLESLIGTPMQQIDLEQIEQNLLQHPVLTKAEVSRQLNGVLYVEVSVRKPLVRLINNSGHYLYMDENGVKFKGSRLHGANVPLIRGDFEEALADTFACSTIESALPVFRFIRSHPFWDAMISEIVIEQDGQLELYPQLGRTVIDFGFPERIEEKFENLRLFYHQVANKAGWRTYRRVSLKYRGQVVASK